MSLVELTPDLSDTVDELRGIRTELKRLADMLETIYKPRFVQPDEKRKRVPSTQVDYALIAQQEEEARERAEKGWSERAEEEI